MSKALYRKYRSMSLDEIVGQEHITAILKRAIEQDKVAHAYLLTGPKGVGKTSIARIMAHAINQLPYTGESQHLDIIEIDAASNNSVDDVRDLREKVQLAPVSAKRKVYIIDEVHMLSKQAFNALLKTLEEPPEHIVFILATTDADKLPATIISRVQRFNFRAINEQDTIKHLKTIAKKEKIAIDDTALRLIATHGKGSFRDSIGLLDQMQHVSDDTINYEMVASILGLADQEVIDNLITAYRAGDLQTIVAILNNAASRGTPAAIITEQLIQTIRLTIATKPELLLLLDDLLDVAKSAWPEIKLLTALTKTAAVTAPLTPQQPTERAAQSAESAPAQPAKITPKTTEPTSSANVSPSRAKVTERKTAITTKPNLATIPAKVAPVGAAPAAIASQPFDWQMFIDALKPIAAGAFSILKGCGYDYDGTELTIYAGKRFNKTKLDKSMPELNTALRGLGMQVEVMVTDATKPSKDATTAAILDMMGGGEELSASE